MNDYALLIPEFLLVIAAFWALFADKFPGRDRGAAFVAAVLAIAGSVVIALQPTGQTTFNDILTYDTSARFARMSIMVLTAVWMIWVAGKKETHIREAVACGALIATGALLMSSTQELIMLLIAIELSTLPAYILVGYRRNDRRSLEGALKYFLLSMTTSLVMLYGFSLMYGVSGTTHFSDLGSQTGLLPVLACMFIFVGLFAKLSIAPFHFWAPDAYEGANTWIVAFISTIPKIASFVVLMRLATVLLPISPQLVQFIVLASVASMVLGNFAALGQHDIRRVMAYSGVAQIGYALIITQTRGTATMDAALYFIVAYAVATLGVLLAVGNESPKINRLAGFGRRHPVLAGSAAILLLSLIGIPPLAGFMGKLYLFKTALESGSLLASPGNLNLILVIIAVVASVVSAAYYLRIVKVMFFNEELVEFEETSMKKTSPFAAFAVVACVLLVAGIGVFSSQILSFM